MDAGAVSSGSAFVAMAGRSVGPRLASAAGVWRGLALKRISPGTERGVQSSVLSANTDRGVCKAVIYRGLVQPPSGAKNRTHN